MYGKIPELHKILQAGAQVGGTGAAGGGAGARGPAAAVTGGGGPGQRTG